jgi:RNA polymerase sigma-70 factor (ECF subfamily)
VEQARLLGRAMQGDREALDALLRVKNQRLVAFAFRILGNMEDAKDAVQESLLRAWQEFFTFSLPAAAETEAGRIHRFDAWLLKITYRQSVDAYRRRKRHPLAVVRDFSALPDPRSGEPDSLLELEKFFQMASMALTERQRAAFLLCVIEGMSSEEAARLLDTEASTVRNLLMQARQTLRRLASH